MGYHKRKIIKGTLGEPSKIKEEFDELFEAIEQNNPILELCEMCDLIGAIESYSYKYYNISLEQLIKMTKCTQEAFKEGERK